MIKIFSTGENRSRCNPGRGAVGAQLLHLGRGVVHRHGVPPGVLPEVPHVPAVLPADGAGAVRADERDSVVGIWIAGYASDALYFTALSTECPSATAVAPLVPGWRSC